MTTYRILLAASLSFALMGCGSNDEQAQAQSPAIESSTPLGNAGPPPGAAPASGLGDANTAPDLSATSAATQPIATDGSTVAADGTNAGTAASDTTGDAGQMQGQEMDTATDTAPAQTPPTQ
ncbi:hypothetical protein [Cognatilysobacter bugurensis]|uniref:Lipoprotein n=1 Tax=Cognatilysobacter bugurensis TaxID=543356 RepID=A0A918SXU4_9GAMM|nr:hypothetical protein [Lysobacter bugurensis]GHA72470.1 hypothetical protein GCM10007067_06210 [Lysobacter bugurensis]